MHCHGVFIPHHMPSDLWKKCIRVGFHWLDCWLHSTEFRFNLLRDWFDCAPQQQQNVINVQESKGTSGWRERKKDRGGEKREKESGSDGSDSKENREAQSAPITEHSNKQETEDVEDVHNSAPRRRGGKLDDNINTHKQAFSLALHILIWGSRLLFAAYCASMLPPIQRVVCFIGDIWSLHFSHCMFRAAWTVLALFVIMIGNHLYVE